MNPWIKSHEVAVITAAGAIGTLVASLLGITDLTTLVAVGVNAGSIVHIVDRVLQAFVSSLSNK